MAPGARQIRYWRQAVGAAMQGRMKSRPLTCLLALAALASSLAACTPDFGETRPTATAATPAAPPVNMAGRWRLGSAKGGACGMTFTAAGPEGTIAPEGG